MGAQVIEAQAAEAYVRVNSFVKCIYDYYHRIACHDFHQDDPHCSRVGELELL